MNDNNSQNLSVSPLVASATTVVLTSFEGAMQPNNPAAGWSYLWNSGGVIGNPANYSALLPTSHPTFLYDSDGISGVPDPSGNWGFLGKSSTGLGLGHPGEGPSDDNVGFERYAIAAYTLSSTGEIWIDNGLLTNRDSSTDGLDLKIYANSQLVYSNATSAGIGQSVNFSNLNLGNLAAGTVIYVAVGPKSTDFHDSFSLQYSIASAPTLPTLSINDIIITEGNSSTKNAIFTVTRTGTATHLITVNYTTANGTASAGSDYTETNGTLTLAINEAAKTITVPILGDTTVEQDKTFFVNLSNPTNATITDIQGRGTITNDDITPSILSFSSPQFSVREDSTSIAAVTVIRTGGDGSVSAKINLSNGTATEPSDYDDNASITVSFASGENSKTVTIPIVKDANPEPDETINLTLTNPLGNATIGQQNSAILTIVDKDGPIITGFPQGTTGSNKGQTTIIIAGQNFSPTDRINLIASNGTAKAASKVYWVSETEAWATFNLQELTTGKYDVKCC